ncbi:hypothetical protein PFISCL1PPCAC_1000, partial [Pristionchus fissidentatus]
TESSKMRSISLRMCLWADETSQLSHELSQGSGTDGCYGFPSSRRVRSNGRLLLCSKQLGQGKAVEAFLLQDSEKRQVRGRPEEKVLLAQKKRCGTEGTPTRHNA